MNAWAILFVFALGADVEAVLPSAEECHKRMLAADKTWFTLAQLHRAAGGWATERKVQEAWLDYSFWLAATEYQRATTSRGDDPAAWIEERIRAARSLRELLGWLAR